MEILADVVRHAVFPESVLAREKEVQLASIKADRESPFTVAGQALNRRLLEGHPHGMPAMGTPGSVESITQDDLLRYRDEYLVARNGVLSIFGDASEAQAVDLAGRFFGGLPEGVDALREPLKPGALEESVKVSEVIDRQQAVIMIGYRGVDMFDPDEPALSLLDEACSDLGSRMFVRIREQLGLAYTVGSSQFCGLSCGTFVFYVGTDPLKQTAVLAELQAEFRGAAAGKGLGLALELSPTLPRRLRGDRGCLGSKGSLSARPITLSICLSSRPPSSQRSASHTLCLRSPVTSPTCACANCLPSTRLATSLRSRFC
jgi:zinc protease